MEKRMLEDLNEKARKQIFSKYETTINLIDFVRHFDVVSCSERKI